MTDNRLRLDRRRAIQVLGASGAVALAGCVGGDDDVDADDEATDGMDDDQDDDEAAVDDDTDDDDDDGEEADTDLQALVDRFDDEPFNEEQMEIEGDRRDYTPAHVWKWVSEETFIALHLNDPNPEEADGLLYVVIGQKGAFSEESQPNDEFTHFHLAEAEGWADGHGGSDPEDEGYWLTHIAADEFEMDWGTVEVGVDYDFMPTPPEEESEGIADFDVGGEGSLSNEDRDALIDLFDFDWTNDDQREIGGEMREYTPSHVWWEPPTDSDTVVFLHFDEANPEEANDLIYYGIGQAGTFTNDDNPNPEDFTHFHLADADDWEAGHGGDDAEDDGYWLIHHAVRPLEMPWGDVEVGVDRDFMPTPAE